MNNKCLELLKTIHEKMSVLSLDATELAVTAQIQAEYNISVVGLDVKAHIKLYVPLSEIRSLIELFEFEYSKAQIPSNL